jgi:hypothetical protein
LASARDRLLRAQEQAERRTAAEEAKLDAELAAVREELQQQKDNQVSEWGRGGGGVMDSGWVCCWFGACVGRDSGAPTVMSGSVA